MKATAFVCLLFGLGVGPLGAAECPQAEISNGLIQMKLYLPDPEQGYYRATRFDWSGIVASLQYEGHDYFGQWFERYDPKVHDSIVGPVEEFFEPLGFDEVDPAGGFVKIGVGALRKPGEQKYNNFRTYEILDAGKWTISKGFDWIEFIHELKDVSGYGYIYRKTLRLTKDKPELVLEHSLKNTGEKVIKTSVYNHNVFMLDSQPSGPDFVVKFPFRLRAPGTLGRLVEIRNKELIYLRELEKGQSVLTILEGYGDRAEDHDIRIENRKTGTGVRVTSNRPIAKMQFWSIRTTICPEAYINIEIGPGRESAWRINYEFYAH